MTNTEQQEPAWWPDGAEPARVLACNCRSCRQLVDVLWAAWALATLDPEGQAALGDFPTTADA